MLRAKGVKSTNAWKASGNQVLHWKIKIPSKEYGCSFPSLWPVLTDASELSEEQLEGLKKFGEGLKAERPFDK